MLNCSLTDTEIENVVRNLPNNKAVECIFLKSACEGEVRLTSPANELNRLLNILVKTLLKQLSRLIGL
jgi:hypothetical protein